MVNDGLFTLDAQGSKDKNPRNPAKLKIRRNGVTNFNIGQSAPKSVLITGFVGLTGDRE